MAFNFGAFLGGFSEAVSENVKTQEKRGYEKELLEEQRQYEKEEYDRRQRAARESAAASARAAEAREAEERLGSLISLGYSPDAAAEIAKGGKYAAQRAINIGERAWERNVDVGTLYRIRPNLDDVDETVSNATPQAPAIGEISDAAEAGQQYGWNREVYATIFGEPNELSNSYGAYISTLTQRIARTTDPDARAELEAQRQAAIDDYAEFKDAERAPDQQETSVFNFGTLPAAVNEALKNSRTRYGFETDIEGNILNMTEGSEYKSYIAELSAAQTLETTYGPLSDRGMNSRINDLRTQASRDLIEYGLRVVSEGDSRRLKPAGTQAEFAQGVVNGSYRIGDVITYQDENGITRFAVYTGIPMEASNGYALPAIIGR
jgi:hypothetical protein